MMPEFLIALGFIRLRMPRMDPGLRCAATGLDFPRSPDGVKRNPGSPNAKLA